MAAQPAPADLARSANSVVLLAERGDQLIGYVQLTGGTLRRSRATAYLVIGVLAHAAGRGTGTELLRQAKALNPRLQAEIQAAVDDANKAVSRAESIRRFRVLAADFTEQVDDALRIWGDVVASVTGS